MAEGVLILLSGEKVKEKQKYLGMEKEYEVEIVWGLETDTGDVLGLVTNVSSRVNLNDTAVEKALHASVGKCLQKYPAYSSRTVNGPTLDGSGQTSKPLFQWAREGKLNEIEIPDHEVEILETPVHKNRREISDDELLKNIEEKIALVKGDFRQKEILEKWRKTLGGRQTEMFTVDTVSLSVSSGFYVRQFVSDLAHSLGTTAVVFHIKRTRVGTFAL
jgi:tRNA pseudouridine(55) synthase